jgi:hypothetical protein
LAAVRGNPMERLRTATKTSRRKAIKPPMSDSMAAINRPPISPLISKPKKCSANAMAINRQTSSAAKMSSAMPM